MVVAWLIWYSRNSVVYDHVQWCAGGIIDKAENLLDEFRAANAGPQLAPAPLPSWWTPPPVGLYKVNFDAAWAKDHSEGGIGVVIRDHSGSFLAGLSKSGCRVSSAEAAELVAAYEAINFAVDAGFRNFLLEGDNIGVMNAIRCNEDGLGSGGAIVADIVKACLSCASLSFCFVKREGNCVAHQLAKYARSILDFVVWLEDPPSWLNDVLSRDVISSI